ncbi:MAG: SufD family Fe-S cluster assembly protein [Simkaniaceae bacterium]|nr:SufD family Fe-S cluster assembly protein [Simkaniaceae bacterium]
MTALVEALKQLPCRKGVWDKWPGFPDKRSEGFAYVSLKRLTGKNDFTHTPPLLHYETPSSIVVLPLREGMQRYRPVLEKRFASLMRSESDPLRLLNHAASQEGLFIYVPDGIRIETPLEIVHTVRAQDRVPAVQPRFEIFLGKGSRFATLIRTRSEGGSFWSNGLINVSVEEGADYSHYDEAERSPEGWDFFAVQGEVRSAGTVRLFLSGRGARVQRRDVSLSLAGEGARVELKGLSLLEEKTEGHLCVRIEHDAPHTLSDQLFKGVLFDRTRSGFEGTVVVGKGARKTEAYQLCRHLILDSESAAFSRPRLQVFTDDVRATHGATVAKPTPGELFYLRTRGLSASEAQAHLVRGFIRELPPFFRHEPASRTVRDDG